MNRSTFRFPAAMVPVAVLALSSCTDSGSGDGASTDGRDGGGGKPVVYAVHYPLAYFAGRIGGDRVEVRFRVPGEVDPAFWEPTDEDIAALQEADLLLLNGANYAKWLSQVSVPESIQFDTSVEYAAWFIQSEEAGSHSHGTDGDHSHTGTAFTTWMDLNQAARQAEAVRDALTELVPGGANAFSTRCAELVSEIEELDAGFKAVGQALGPQPLVASHPVYSYFARQYGLKIESVLWEPETVPDAAALGDLRGILSGHPAKWMIWEGEPAVESVSRLEALGLRSVVVDPCANRPGNGDWLSVMRGNLANLRSALEP